MNGAQFHLLLNHLPSIGQVVGFGIFIFGFLFRKKITQVTGAWVILIAALMVMPANFSGEQAEEVVEHLPGITEYTIHEHEEAAEVALVFTLISGACALLFLAANRWKQNLAIAASILTLLACTASVILLMNASHKGGLIRHPEMANGQTTGVNEFKNEQEDND
jgi:uncharacterized membrane protein